VSFEARPTKGYCEGNYAWHIAEGRVNGTVVDGSTFGMFTKFPGAPHEGNGTGGVYIDEQVPPERRTALEAMIREVPPFGVFYSLLGEIIGHLKRDGHVFDPADLAHQVGKSGHEPACLARKDHLQGFPLAGVSAFVDEEAKRHLGFASPDDAIKRPDANDIEIVQADVTVCACTDVIGQNAFTMIVGWRLCELARTWDITPSNVEPITLHPPLRSVSHRSTPLRWTLRRGTACPVPQTAVTSHHPPRSVPAAGASDICAPHLRTSGHAHATPPPHDPQAQNRACCHGEDYGARPPAKTVDRCAPRCSLPVYKTAEQRKV
jgi:hypothetical protein